MPTATLAYPPPLSAPPTVETLERLLTGLQHIPARRPPAPPPAVATPDRLFEGVPRPGQRARTEPTDAGLTWSAGNGRTLLRPFPFAALGPRAGAAATAATALVVLLSRGDIGLQ